MTVLAAHKTFRVSRPTLYLLEARGVVRSKTRDGALVLSRADLTKRLPKRAA